MTERSRWTVSWWRVVVALVVVFFSIALLEWWTAPFLMARSIGTGEAAVLPVPPPDPTLTTGSASPVKRSGVSFEVPWIETEKSKLAPNSEVVEFTNGLEMFVGRPPRSLEIVRATRGIRAAAVRYELGGDVLSSQFAWTSAALGTTANDAKWWRTPIYNEKVELLLMEKSVVAGLATGPRVVPIYSFSFGQIRGFQIGDPKGRRNAVHLYLFDEADRSCGILLVNSQKVTQSEINALVATLRFGK
jgi:hypothetical protein